MLEATAVTRPKRFLTDLGKFSVAPGTSSPAAPRVCFGLRDGEYRTMTRTPICIIGILGLAAVLAVIATYISTAWQREEMRSQFREMPFGRGLSTPSRLASVPVPP